MSQVERSCFERDSLERPPASLEKAGGLALGGDQQGKGTPSLCYKD